MNVKQNINRPTKDIKFKNMIEQLNDTQKQRKIYTEKNMWLVAFLGGPLSAGYIIAENFKTFNETRKAQITWGITIVVTILIFGSLLALPETIVENIPKQIIPLIYTAIAFAIIQYYQKTRITDYLSDGGEKYGWGRSVCVGFIGLAITLLFVAIIAFLAGDFSSKIPNLESKEYGKLHHLVYYDKTNISENEIDQIALALTETTFFDEALPKEVVVEKINSNYEITISIVKDAINNEEALSYFVQLKNDLQNYFPKNKIVINLAFDNYKDVVKRLE